jgi:crossover junction endodeoxyribonuclease RuvC
MKILGIDPGAGGALTILDTDNSTLKVFDMPVVEIKRGKTTKRHVSAQLVAELLRNETINEAYVEAVHSMPGQGVSSSFSFGRALGVLEGVLAGLQIRTTLVPPATWLKEMRVHAGKDGSRARAVEFWPKHADLFARKKDDGRAESALLAAYGAKHSGVSV